jgi:Tfp pilus assembly protein FimT
MSELAKREPYFPARKKVSGISLLEILITLAVVLTLSGIAVLKFVEALQSVRHLLALIR